MTNVTTMSTTALLARLRALETAARFSRGADEATAAEWQRVRAELDRRPTDQVLASL